MNKDTSDSSTLKHAKSHVEFLLDNSPLYTHLFSNAVVKSATPKHVIVQLYVEQLHVNSKGGLHGSVTAALVDFIGGVAIACHDNRSNTGVSTDMHISFLGSARVGDTVEVEGRADRIGGTLAFTSVVIRKLQQGSGEGQGDLVATGSHTKFVKQR